MDSAARFLLNGALLTADFSGALWWEERRLLVAADLHLEKGTGFARRGTLLPPYDTRETLTRLEQVMSRLSPDIVISLGDSFHDGDAAARLDTDDTA
ncbi:MAG: phosphoesterase, partial [Oceanibaculum nanhaiense]|nr:phosphoesterase [Oceanibaculum nanhaiense]